MRELSVFVDESGNSDIGSRYYLVTLVFHDQDENLSPFISVYENSLCIRGLKNIPLHLNPLMRAGNDYTRLTPKTRRSLLFCFSAFANKAPFQYRTFAYEKKQFATSDELFNRMKRDLINFLLDRLEFFQSFDKVKIYYDDGQGDVTRTLHSGFEYALGKQVIVYRKSRPSDYRLQQVADYACGIELANLKYKNSEESGAEKIFYGTWRDFNKNFLKKLRKHRFD